MTYFHVGGDECNGKEWDANPRIQEFMHAHNLKDNAALQAYFSERVQKIVAKHKKIMEGWDEVLQPNTPKDVVIQSWRGQDSLAEAASRGIQGPALQRLLHRSQSAGQRTLRRRPDGQECR